MCGRHEWGREDVWHTCLSRINDRVRRIKSKSKPRDKLYMYLFVFIQDVYLYNIKIYNFYCLEKRNYIYATKGVGIPKNGEKWM